MNKRAFLSTFRYVVPADYELWLESLAEKGWHWAMEQSDDDPKKG